MSRKDLKERKARKARDKENLLEMVRHAKRERLVAWQKAEAADVAALSVSAIVEDLESRGEGLTSPFALAARRKATEARRKAIAAMSAYNKIFDKTQDTIEFYEEYRKIEGDLMEEEEKKHKIVKEALAERSFRVACYDYKKAYDQSYEAVMEGNTSDSFDPAPLAEQAACAVYDSSYALARKAEEVIQLMKDTTIKNPEEQQER